MIEITSSSYKVLDFNHENASLMAELHGLSSSEVAFSDLEIVLSSIL